MEFACNIAVAANLSLVSVAGPAPGNRASAESSSAWKAQLSSAICGDTWHFQCTRRSLDAWVTRPGLRGDRLGCVGPAWPGSRVAGSSLLALARQLKAVLDATVQALLEEVQLENPHMVKNPFG